MKTFEEKYLMRFWQEEFNGAKIDCDSIEEFYTRQICEYNIGLCLNSIPYFCRIEQYREEYGSRMAYLNPSSSILDKDGIEARYNATCPKAAWGISAYLAYHMEVEGKARFYDYSHNKRCRVRAEDCYKEYLGHCEETYRSLHKQEYEDAEIDGPLAEFHNKFIEDHVQEEKKYLEKTLGTTFFDGRNLNNLFSGELEVVANKYLDWLIERETGSSHKTHNANTNGVKALNEGKSKTAQKERTFFDLIRCPDPKLGSREEILKNLHELIDSMTKPSEIAAVLLQAYRVHYLTVKPSEKLFKKEFPSQEHQKWNSVRWYLNENGKNTIENAQNIVIIDSKMEQELSNKKRQN